MALVVVVESELPNAYTRLLVLFSFCYRTEVVHKNLDAIELL